MLARVAGCGCPCFLLSTSVIPVLGETGVTLNTFTSLGAVQLVSPMVQQRGSITPPLYFPEIVEK